MGKQFMVSVFLKHLQFEKRVSRHTVKAYGDDLFQFEKFLLENYGDLPSSSAEYSIIRSWIIHLAESGLSPRSTNRKIASLRSYFKYLRREGHLLKDPMQKVKVLKTPKKLPQFLKEEEINKILDSPRVDQGFEDHRDLLILEFFYGTGMRLAELIQLQENQIDTKGNTVKVLGKRNKERVIPFPANFVSLIDAYRNLKKREVGICNHSFFFVTQKGKPLYPMMVYRIVKKYLGTAIAEKKSPHVLRHTYATHLLNKGAEINAVKDLLGHSSLAATQVYTHNSIEKLKKAFDQAHPKA